MEVLIEGWIIADGDLPIPRPGEVLSGLGLRLISPMPDAGDRRPVRIDGLTTWARRDATSRLVESVVQAEGFRILTQQTSDDSAPSPAVGAPVSLQGYLRSVGPYEFEAFALPDVSQDWLVNSARQVGLDDFVADLEPVEFRFGS